MIALFRFLVACGLLFLILVVCMAFAFAVFA